MYFYYKMFYKVSKWYTWVYQILQSVLTQFGAPKKKSKLNALKCPIGLHAINLKIITLSYTKMFPKYYIFSKLHTDILFKLAWLVLVQIWIILEIKWIIEKKIRKEKKEMNKKN